MTLVLAELPPSTQQAVAATRERVAALHAELPRNALVVWTAGNVSERVPATDPDVPGLLVIKPSGVSYDELSAETMVVCTLDGEKINDGTPEALTPEPVPHAKQSFQAALAVAMAFLLGFAVNPSALNLSALPTLNAGSQAVAPTFLAWASTSWARLRRLSWV